MKILLTILFTIFASAAFGRDDCATKIIYLKGLPTSTLPDAQARVAASQLLVAQYLSFMPSGLTLLSENIHQDLSLADGSPEVLTLAKKIFPKGLPLGIGEASAEQAEQLARSGAEYVGIALGMVPAIVKVDAGLTVKSQLQLDTLALSKVREYFSNNPKENKIVLIAPATSDILQLPFLFPPQCVIIPPDITEFLHQNF